MKTEKTEIPEAADTGTAGDTPQSGTGTENAAPQENTGDAGCVTGGFADLCRSAALTEKTEPPEKQETPDTGGNMPYDDPETAGQKSRKTGLETAAVKIINRIVKRLDNIHKFY